MPWWCRIGVGLASDSLQSSKLGSAAQLLNAILQGAVGVLWLLLCSVWKIPPLRELQGIHRLVGGFSRCLHPVGVQVYVSLSVVKRGLPLRLFVTGTFPGLQEVLDQYLPKKG